MKCVDCLETILESEHRSFCHTCKGRLHDECVMTSIDDDDLCEDCFIKEQERAHRDGFEGFDPEADA